MSDGNIRHTTVAVATVNADLYKGSTLVNLTITASGGDNDMAHIAEGVYSLELTATDTNTLGSLRISIEDGQGSLPVDEYFEVVSSHIYDMIYGADLLSHVVMSATTENYALNTAGGQLNLIGEARVTVVSPVSDTGRLELYYADDYDALQDRSIIFTDASGNWPNVLSATGTYSLVIGQESIGHGTAYLIDSTTQAISIEINSASMTANTTMAAFTHTLNIVDYFVRGNVGGNDITVSRGSAYVYKVD